MKGLGRGKEGRKKLGTLVKFCNVIWKKNIVYERALDPSSKTNEPAGSLILYWLVAKQLLEFRRRGPQIRMPETEWRKERT